MERLDGRVVVVSGASRGIGKGLALGLADAGSAVVCAARSSRAHPGELPGTVEDTAEEIGARGGRAVPVRADIGVDEDVQRMINVAVDEYGRLDVLVNNAMASTRNTFDDMTFEQWDTSWRINVRSLFVTCSAAVKAMAANDGGAGGSIINISSGAADALMPPDMLPPGYLAYSVAKAAMERFSTALAPEVADRNIAVNALRPGAVKTEQSVHELGEDFDWSMWREPSFVVPMVHCLALQRADGLTGRILDVNSYGTTWACD